MIGLIVCNANGSGLIDSVDGSRGVAGVLVGLVLKTLVFRLGSAGAVMMILIRARRAESASNAY